MAFLLIEGFDSYPDVAITPQGMQARWLPNIGNTNAYAGVALVAGRYGGQAANFGEATGFFGQNYGANYALTGVGAGTTTLTCGFAFQLNIGVTTFQAVHFYNGGVNSTNVFGLGINNSQQLYLWTGNAYTIIATDSLALSLSAWHYIEIVWTAATSVQLYLDGLIRPLLTVNGAVGTLPVDTIAMLNDGIGRGASHFSLDDIYVTNTAVRVGEARVSTLNVASNDVVAWTPLASTNASQVSEVLNDGGTTYNSTVTINAQDTFNINPLPSTPATIYAVQVIASTQKSDATTHTAQTVIKSGATTTTGTTFAITGSYIYNYDIYPNDPNTSAPWLAAAVNASKIGYKLIL